MRPILLSAALIALAACSQHAGAQSPADFTGAWAFRTDAFNNDPNSSINGAAIVTDTGHGHYTLRLVANQFVAQGPTQPVQAKPGERPSAQPRVELIAAHESCNADLSGQQFTVTCQLSEPLAHYTPDNFILQTQDADTLAGVISSGEDQVQVTFSRVR